MQLILVWGSRGNTSPAPGLQDSCSVPVIDPKPKACRAICRALRLVHPFEGSVHTVFVFLSPGNGNYKTIHLLQILRLWICWSISATCKEGPGGCSHVEFLLLYTRVATHAFLLSELDVTIKAFAGHKQRQLVRWLESRRGESCDGDPRQSAFTRFSSGIGFQKKK